MFPFLNHAPRPQGMTAAQAVAGANSGEVTILDIREVAEVRASGLAKGAVHVPLMMLQHRADPRHPDHDPRLSPDGTIAVYCASGARSAGAAQMLTKLGYRDVHNIGGLAHWAQAGGAVTPA